VHNNLAEITSDCDICHQGAGSQTTSHFNAVVNVALSGYNAQSGTASYNTGSETCSRVSCHGGQDTPVWLEALDVDGECEACHSLQGEYNSYTSGKHKKHVEDKNIACFECHDTGKLGPVHFNDLYSTNMNEAGQTIRGDMNYDGTSCLLTCHIDNKKHDQDKKW
jgi:predicted CxxxxCH...CXXCH cytochrome family protein